LVVLIAGVQDRSSSLSQNTPTLTREGHGQIRARC